MRLEQHQPLENTIFSSTDEDTAPVTAIGGGDREVESSLTSDANNEKVMTDKIQVHISQDASVDTKFTNSSSHEVIINECKAYRPIYIRTCFLHLRFTQLSPYHSHLQQFITLNMIDINPETKETIIASLGADKERLELFSMYKFGQNYSKIEKDDSGRILCAFQQRTLDLNNNETKKVLLELWRNESLLSQSSDPLNILHAKSNFEDLLQSYATRIEMLRNESRKDHLLLDFLVTQHIKNMSWTHYIRNPAYDYNETLVVLKDLAVWFRSEFPYFYDACLAPECGNKENNSFTGYIYPSEIERSDKAGRTELYLCGKCGGQHRFPRFNNVIKVLETRRGRCGEYSVLFLRMLRLLGYQVRWVVDWADHVWIEVLYSKDTAGETINRRWIHADPCEAAVDEPLLYQSWGKNQTYILAFSDIAADNAAFALTSKRLISSNSDVVTMPKQYHGVECYHDGDSIGVDKFEDTIAVVDVTATYTTDLEAAYDRREVRDDEFVKALNRLKAKMKEIPEQ